MRIPKQIIGGKYTFNTLWMVSDKLITSGLSFIVMAYAAREFGLTDFGALTYAIAITTLFGVAGHLGLNALVVRELVSKKWKAEEIMSSVFFLKFFAMLLAIVLANLFVLNNEGGVTAASLIVFTISISLMFQVSDVFDYYFQSITKSKYVMYSRVISSFVGSIAKVLLILFSFPVLWFALAYSLQFFLFLIIVAVFYFFRREEKLSTSPYKVNFLLIKKLISESWMIYLGTIFSIIYLKLDQVMINDMLGKENVAVYAVGSMISEALYFLPVAIASSIFPKLIVEKEKGARSYQRFLKQIMSLLFYLGLIVSLVLSLLSDHIIDILFGPEYSEAASILAIHAWACIFIFMRSLFSRWIVVEKQYAFSLVSQGLGAFSNIALNYYMIPIYGIIGAAWATLISYSIASFFSLAIYSKTRGVFFIMLTSPFSLFGVKSDKEIN